MTPYNHLRSQNCNASWRGIFMYIAQLAPHKAIHSGCGSSCCGVYTKSAAVIVELHNLGH